MATVGCDLVVHQGMCRCLVKWEMGTAFESVGVEPESVEPLSDRLDMPGLTTVTRARKRQMPLTRSNASAAPEATRGKAWIGFIDERAKVHRWGLPNPDRCPSAPTMATSTSW